MVQQSSQSWFHNSGGGGGADVGEGMYGWVWYEWGLYVLYEQQQQRRSSHATPKTRFKWAVPFANEVVQHLSVICGGVS
jgi:hypothetical protein